ncbi:MAG: hypothetical protein ACI9HK_000738 [Pirellulaceae bacterium]|jgi:hypothetical protein
MSDAELANATKDNEQVALEGGTYEIIRNRLLNQGGELKTRLEKLNAGRKEVFGSINNALLGTERITTDHNCVPRDMVAIGNKLIFGYNVHFGLKSEINVGDVFAVYEFKDKLFHGQSLDMINQDQFVRDFGEVYRYYKNAEFSRFFVRKGFLYMVFQVGRAANDIKSLKWLIEGDSLRYIDSRSDHEVKPPPQYDFEWIRTTRDQHRAGDHPHISIADRVFVECVGGDLTIKIENNTESGQGIYAEDVDNKDQTLDDAEIYYAIVGNIILFKIRPYQEKQFRYIVFNEKIQRAIRIDSIEHSCVLLPDDHGLIFSNGYYLQDGEYKTFENELTDMKFERRVLAQNGEDYLYVFYNTIAGVYVQLHYNLIQQKVDTPLICHGSTFFDGGEMLCFKTHDEPQKHHAIQIWQTPYVGQDYIPHTNTDSFLYKIGNRDLVRGMAECHEVMSLINKEDTYEGLYVDLVRKAGDVLDSYFWIGNPETHNLDEPLKKIRSTAESAIEEFEKVVRVKQNTAGETKRVEDQTREMLAASHHRRYDIIDDFVTTLGDLRGARGEVISLKERKYVNHALLESLEKEVAEQSEKVAQRCVQFLLDPKALGPYQKRVNEHVELIPPLRKVTAAKELEGKISDSAAELEMLIDIVSNLKIDDATHRTTIIDNISVIFSTINQARAAIKTKKKDLMSVEGVAEFNSQMKLLNQGVVNYLDICDSPEKCEEFLTKVMIQLEELEGRFAEFDEFVIQLTDKREEIYNAFETRKLSLIEARNRRASSLMSAAERILKGIKSRADGMESVNDINSYFAADLMIEKIRDITGQLTKLDDNVKVDDIQSRLKTIKEDAVRQLKDRQDLFVGGANIIQLGQHRFSVNVQQLDLTTVLRDGEMQFHLTGTNFFENIEDELLLSTRQVWDQEVISETPQVYRGEYLAYRIHEELAGNTAPSLQDLANFSDEELSAFVQSFMGPRYTEAYVKGVHDQDGAKILRCLLEMKFSIGLLRYHSIARSLARAYWNNFCGGEQKELMSAKLRGFGTISQLFPDSSAQMEYVKQLRGMMKDFINWSGLYDAEWVPPAAEYLFYELSGGAGFATSRIATDLFDEFHTFLRSNTYEEKFSQTMKDVAEDSVSSVQLARDWMSAFVANRPDANETQDYIDEAAVLLVDGKVNRELVVDGQVRRQLDSMIGAHGVIQQHKYHVNFNQFFEKLNKYEREIVPLYRTYIERKKEIVDHQREGMKLDEFKPRVLTSFVRNKLIDEVYLPIIGDNLAKQIGVIGEGKRTDLMGLLLLLSPPGYGKTTLMEYIANRLGVIFMKINGPAIGHNVTSLDPNEAPNAGAREEVEKLNLSLEMGDNVMIYLDDIQHCNPEFLQKFISLCDGQRKIEGVYKGRTRTYDLRGRKVIVVMAGNPYTESGEKFQIPDMLANRADVYNLGEIIGETARAFEMSYLENCLTSSAALNRLASRSQQDVYSIIKIAETDDREGIELEGSYSLEDVSEMVTVMKKLMYVRDIILKVNREYIRSAAQSDDYRTEPPFKLQGSYRNMNRIAEKVVPIMNDEELRTLILSNYENDSQTLTSDNEANMLKFKELMEILNEEEALRWASIKRTFSQNLKMRGIDADDSTGQVILQLREFNDGLESIRHALSDGVAKIAFNRREPEVKQADPSPQLEELVANIGSLRDGLHGIREALSGGISEEAFKDLAAQLKEIATIAPAPALPTASDGPVEAQLVNPGGGLDDLTPLASSSAPSAKELDKLIERKITVQHKVPRTILNVLKSQFELMHNWMVPIFHAQKEQGKDFGKLQNSMNLCLDNYESLLKELESAGIRKIPKKKRGDKTADETPETTHFIDDNE